MLAIAYAVSGGAYDFYAFDAAGLVYNGSAWVAWADIDFEDYRIPAAESGESGRFVATLPDDTARYAMRASGADLAGSYLVWEEAVGSGGLLPDERTKVMLIGTEGALAEIVTPIADGGAMTLWTGIDYVTGAYGPIDNDLPAAAQSRAPAVSEAIYFQIRRRRADLDQVFEVAGTIVDSAVNPGTKALDIPIPKSALSRVKWFDDQWLYFIGDRPESDKQDAFVAGQLTMCPGPFPPE